jgi:hypothetical protein
MKNRPNILLLFGLIYFSSVSQIHTACSTCGDFPINTQLKSNSFEGIPTEGIQLEFNILLLNDTSSIQIDPLKS